MTYHGLSSHPVRHPTSSRKRRPSPAELGTTFIMNGTPTQEIGTLEPLSGIYRFSFGLVYMSQYCIVLIIEGLYCIYWLIRLFFVGDFLVVITSVFFHMNFRISLSSSGTKLILLVFLLRLLNLSVNLGRIGVFMIECAYRVGVSFCLFRSPASFRNLSFFPSHSWLGLYLDILSFQNHWYH